MSLPPTVTSKWSTKKAPKQPAWRFRFQSFVYSYQGKECTAFEAWQLVRIPGNPHFSLVEILD